MNVCISICKLDDGVVGWWNQLMDKLFHCFHSLQFILSYNKGLMVVSGQVIIELCDVDVFHT